MTNEEKVRKKYPNAEVTPPDPVHEGGQGSLYQQRGWTIYPSKGLGVQPIGEGPTLEAAWKKAADAVELQGKVELMVNIEKWLLGNGYVPSTQEADRLEDPNDSEAWVKVNRDSGTFHLGPRANDAFSKATAESR